MLCSVCAVMHAQTVVTVGTGTSSNYYAPFGHYYENSWYECIYPASEINAAGTITAVAYNVASAYSTSCSAVRIYMGTTTSSTHSSYTAWVPASDLTLVYEALNTTIGATTGWETFNLTTPFFYDGLENLVIVVAHAANDWNSDLQYYYTNVSGSCMYRWADADVTYSQHPGNNSAEDIIDERPNIQLTMTTGPITCPAPSYQAVTGTDAYSTTFYWTSNGSETSWDIVLNTTGVAPTETSPADFTATDTFYTFQGLTPSTQYYAYVRANCGAGDYSGWRSASFLTSQIPALLPYSQDWENGTENAQWTIDNSGGVNQWYIGAAVNNTAGGDSSLYISNTNGATNAYDISSTSNVWAYRDIDFGTYAEYSLSCDVSADGESCCDYLKIFVGPPATPNGSSTPAGAVQVGGNINQLTSFTNITATLNASFSGVQRVYLLWHNDGSVGTMPPAAVDNIVITGSNCGSPYDLTVDSTTTTSIAFHFTAAAASDASWQVVLMPAGVQVDETQAITLTSTSYEFTGLTANTLYNIYVRTDCGSEYSNWTMPLSVRTDCDLIYTLPYTETFDAYGAGSSTYFPSCWTRNSTYSTSYPYISSTNHSAPGSLYFYCSSVTNNHAIMPEIDPSISLNTLTLSLMMRSSSTAYELFVGVVDSLTDMSTFVPVETLHVSATNTWELKEIPLTNYQGTGHFIALKVQGNGSTSRTIYVDDVQLFVTPTCLRPIDLVTSSITSSGATVDWTPRNNETTWQVVVVPHGTAPDQGTPEYTYSHPYTIQNLTDNTQYDVYVKSDCGGEESNWSLPASFYTLCLPTSTIPYVENFGSYGMGSQTYYPNCWSRYQTGTTTTYPYISSTGGGSLYFYSTSSIMDYGASQALDLSNEIPGTLQLSFDVYKSSSSYGRINAGYMTDPGDMSTFHLLKAIYPGDLPATSTWYNFNVQIPDAAYLSEVYFAFEAPMSGTTNYVYLDNVTVDYLPTCSAPSHFEVSNVAGNSALLTWHEAPYGAMDYTVEYAEANTGNFTSQVVTGNSYMLSGLDQQTSYQVLLYSNCGSDYSDTLTLTFTTGCLAGGDNIVGTGTNTTYNIPLNTFYNYSYVQQLYLASEINNSGDIHSIGFQYIYSTSQTKNNQSIYLAETDLTSLSTWVPADSLTLVYSGSINYNNSGPDNWVTITLDSAFTYSGTRNLVVVLKNDHGSYSTSSNYTFKAHSASGMTLHYYSDSDPFSLTSPSSSSTYSSRNNIKFGMDCDNTVTCIAPNVYVASYDATSANIAWAPGSTESSWELEYKLSSSSTWTSVGTVTSSPYLLDNLSSNATYNIRMRSECGSDHSSWASTSVTIPCMVTALPFNEDFSTAGGSGSSYFVPCWQRKTNYSTSYPYTSSTYSHSSPYALYFYGTSSYYSMAITPRFDDSIEMDSLLITFWSYKTSANYFIEVGIISDPNDMSTFEPLGQFCPSAVSTWEKAEFKTNTYLGNGRFVAFRIPQWATSYQYIDDISIDYIPLCAHVENLTATNITPYSADIHWTAGGSEDTWEILYGPNVDLQTDQPTAVYAASESLTGLTPNTYYHVYVRPACGGGDFGTWEHITFWTGCVPIASLPYTENFDLYAGTTSTSVSVNNLPNCWSNYNTGTTYQGYPINYNSSTYAHSLNNVMRFYSYTSSSYGDQYAILPEIDVNTLPINTLRLSFSARAYSTSSTYQAVLVIGVAPNNMTPSTFTPLDTLTITSTTHQTYQFNFPNYTGNGTHFVILGPRPSGGASYNHVYVDDVVIDFPPQCTAPTNLSVGTVSANSVDLTWTDAATESSWELVYAANGQNPDYTQPITTTTNSYSFTNLNPNTQYTFYLRTQCSNGLGYSDWVSTSAWTISANPAQVPYVCDFSDPVENDEWVFVNGTQTNKWYIGQPTGETDTVMFISDNGTTETYTITSASNVWAYRDIQFGTGAEFPIDITWKAVGESCCDYLRFYLGTPNPVTAGSITDPVGSEQLSGNLNQQSGWQHFTTTLNSSYANTTKRLYILWHNDGSVGTAPAGVIDNVSITASDCGAPHTLTASNLTTTSFDLDFTPALPTDDAWEYVIGPAGSQPSTLTPQPITTIPVSISNLTSATSYVVYVRTVCVSGSYSSWSTPLTVTTNCDDITTLPYNEGFDTYGTGTTAYPTCWRKINTYSSDRPYVNSTNYAGVGSLYFFTGTSGTYNIAIMPPIDASIPVNTLQATFMYRGYYSSDRLIVGVMTNPTDASTFVPVDTVYPASSASTWIEQEVPLATYAGTGQYIAFKNEYTTTSAYAYIDNLSVDLIPACAHPVNLTISNVDNSSATVSWTPVGTETSWIVEYKAATATTWSTANATSTSYTITGLNAMTNYSVRVKADCGNGESSSYVNGSFTTQNCALSDLCDYTFVLGDGYGDGWNGASMAIQQGGNTVATITAVNHGLSSTQTYDTVTVSLCDNISTSLVWTTGSFDDEISVYIYGPDGTLVMSQIDFEYYTTYTFTTDCSGAPATCNAPTGLAVNNVTTTTATASWTAGGTETSWNVQYKAASASNWQSATATSTSYTMTGLTANTAYQVRVQAVCDASTTSDWTSAVSFTTSQEQQTCPAPTNLTATLGEQSHTTVVLTWQQEANTANEWQINYRISSESTWSTVTANATTYTLTDLTPNESYVAHVVAHCTNGLTSDESNTVTFDTDNIGIGDHLAKSVNLYPNPATEMIAVEVSDANIMITGVEVYNVYGQLINTIISTENPLRINVSGLADGMYYVRVTTDSGVVTKNFVKR